MLHKVLLLALLSFLLPAMPLGMGAATFAFEGWIGEGRPVFTAEQPVKSRLYLEHSTGSEAAGVCTLNPGGKLTFRSSFVVTTRPLMIVVDADLKRSVTSWGRTQSLSQLQYYKEGRKKTLSFAAGSSVEMLMYRAEGACLFRSKGEVFQANCFDFQNLKSTEGVASEWWLQVKCGQDSGWILMDAATLGLFKMDRSF